MIILHANGQLGNQLIQLLAVQSMAAPGEWIIAVNFHQACKLVQRPPNAFWVGSGHHFSFVARCLAFLLRKLEAWPLWLRRGFISYLVESSEGYVAASIPRFARFGAISWIQDIYLQNDQYFDRSHLSSMPILSSVRSQAQRWLTARQLHQRPKIFLHIRRGDYLSWSPLPGQNLGSSLPIGFFFDSLEECLKQWPTAATIVASDDLDYARKCLGTREHVFFIDVDAALTLALLSECCAGVLSPSTFSWAAAAYAASSVGAGPFIAPLHWLGFRVGQQYPPLLLSSFLSYRAVDC